MTEVVDIIPANLENTEGLSDPALPLNQPIQESSSVDPLCDPAIQSLIKKIKAKKNFTWSISRERIRNLKKRGSNP